MADAERQRLAALHCRASFERHGPEQALDQLLPELRAMGVEPRVLVLYRQRAGGGPVHPWVARMREAGLTAEQIPDPGPLSIGVLRRMARRVRSSGAQVLHTHDYKTNVLGGLIARRSSGSMPWVATVHLQTTTTRRLTVYRALDLFLLRLADRVVTVSRDQRRLLLRRGVDRHRLVLVPNVIDVDGFAATARAPEETRAELGLRPDWSVVTLIGRLTTQKGVDTFLEAARAVCDVNSRVTFIVVGDGPERAALEGRAALLELGDRVRFLGYRTDTASLLRASDVVVLTSRSEGLPLVLLEAMAVGRPVVATRVGGIPDVVLNGHSGLLVSPDAPVDVAEQMLVLLDDRELALRLGENGNRHVRARYAPRAAARRLAAVYRTVVAERT